MCSCGFSNRVDVAINPWSPGGHDTWTIISLAPKKHPYLEKKYENRLFHGTRPKDNPLPRVELEAPCQGYTHFVQLKSPTSTQLGYKVCIVKHWKPLRYISFELNRASFNVSWCPSYLQFLLPPFCVCHDLSASRMYTSCNPQVQCMKLKKIKCCSNMLKLGASVSLFLEARVQLHKLLMFVCQKTLWKKQTSIVSKQDREDFPRQTTQGVRDTMTPPGCWCRKASSACGSLHWIPWRLPFLFDGMMTHITYDDIWWPK